MLVHGGGAHSGWWDHIAPYFAGSYRVVALDLSGHGDSGTRDAYRLQQWGNEVMAAAASVGADGRPIIVGHSMGGWVTSAAATQNGEDINCIIVIDSPLRGRAPEEAPLRQRKRRPTGYRSKDEIIAKFRPVPTQDVVLPFVSEHIARESVRRTLKGWVWKFDPNIFGGHLFDGSVHEQETMESMMTRLACRVGFIRCGNGLVPAEMAQQIRAVLQLRGPFIELAEAGHHPMLDQPLPLVATLRAMLEFWSIT
ncbi:peroxidase BpoB [Mycolicibacter sinensis]|uniref:Peroxidase BpoB n=1 Tax=Mycolicibacter sinensis (strain JDM601) TaxID=875328 RepID=F5YRM7_MYCSD|nr:peroxidase BpoB [Mycolicibacter sinensis]